MHLLTLCQLIMLTGMLFIFFFFPTKITPSILFKILLFPSKIPESAISVASSHGRVHSSGQCGDERLLGEVSL